AAATQEAMRRADDLRRSISERRQAARQRSIEAGEALGALNGAASGGSGIGGVGGSSGNIGGSAGGSAASRDGFDAGAARPASRVTPTDTGSGPPLGRPRGSTARGPRSGAATMATGEAGDSSIAPRRASDRAPASAPTRPSPPSESDPADT